MIKALMIPIRPEYAVNILNGKKTLDLRTWIPKDYVGWVYIYVTKNEPYLIWNNGNYILYTPKINLAPYSLNGKVAFRFWFDEFIKLEWLDISLNVKNNLEWLLPKLCLNKQQVIAYGKGKVLYAWHIKKLEIFDKPKKLSDFYVTNKGLTYKYIKEYEEQTNDNISFRLKKAPRKMVWVYTKEN